VASTALFIAGHTEKAASFIGSSLEVSTAGVPELGLKGRSSWLDPSAAKLKSRLRNPVTAGSSGVRISSPAPMSDLSVSLLARGQRAHAPIRGQCRTYVGFKRFGGSAQGNSRTHLFAVEAARLFCA